MLCKAFAVHQISILVKFGFKFRSTRLCEHVEQREDLGMLLCQLLDGRQVFELSEVDDIDSLDRKDDAPSSVILSLSDRAIILFV